jgi:DNA-binding beta-propeller fold protein YncE
MTFLKVKSDFYIGALFLGLLVILGTTATILERTVDAQGRATEAPRFEVDPFWPKPLPHNWVLGNTIGAWVDDQDHLWVVHRTDTLTGNENGAVRNPPTGECCAPAPPVLSFDQAGNLVRHWGGPGSGYDWPASNHGIFVDHLGYVWIGGNGPSDSHVLKFTKDGKFVAQYGKPGVRQQGITKNSTTGQDEPNWVRGSNDPANFGRVAKIFVDRRANEAYLADGYFNRRVAVLDANSGKLKRYWGAYGNKPDDTYQFPPRGPNEKPAEQFRGPVHCADLSNDNLLYVCDRQSNRIQVFTAEGKFVKEGFIQKESLGEGSTWDVAFSRDAQQRYLYVADGRNMKVHILLRETLQEITNFGKGGRYPGMFFGVHSIATDSRGNIYTTETYEGKRIQKFVFKGMGRATTLNQGPPWPTGKQ